MITLNSDTKFGKGLHRECFVHPDDDQLCIKVVTYGNQQETKREQNYYKQLQKRNIAWNLLPKFHGNIETSMGPGAVFDLIRDHDGEISKTLEHYLKDAHFTQNHRTQIEAALTELKQYLLKYSVMSMAMKPKNILYQLSESGKGKLFIIDNIGNSDFIPICNYVPYFANKKIVRRWDRFINKLAL
jgi:PhoP regulatory network protein YrbL